MGLVRQSLMALVGWAGVYAAAWSMEERAVVGIPAILLSAGVVWALYRAEERARAERPPRF